MAQPQEYQLLLDELNLLIQESRKVTETNLRNTRQFLAAVEKHQKRDAKRQGKCIAFPVNLHLKNTAL